MTSLRSGSATDVGRVRNSNQDVALEDPDLFAVADGMGGHVGGEVAAKVAVDSLRGSFQRQPTVEGLRRAVAEANRAVWRQGQTETGLRGMGTTLTATALVQETDGRQVIALANVGDSRAYVYSKGQVIQVTADHSLAEEKVRQGQLTEAEAAVHPHRHILTRALGVASDVDVDLWELHLHDGDRILLCSDGLTNEVGDEVIGDVLAKVGDPSEAAKALVNAAVDHGGSDNVTCIVIDVVGAGPSGTAVPGAAAVAAAATVAAGDQTAQGGSGPAEASGGVRGASSTRTLRAVSGSAVSGSAVSKSAVSKSAVSGTRLPTSAVPKTPGAGVTANARSAIASVGPRTLARGAAGVGDTAGAQDGGSGEDSAARDGAAAREPGSLAAARLQAAELRRLRPRDDRRYRRRSAGVPRLITVRVVLFVILLLGVVAAAYFAMRWYAMDDWYVGVDHGHLAVYQGRPGGFLWFEPQLVDDTPVTTKQVLPYTIPHDRQEPSLSAAKSYVRNLHAEYLATKGQANQSNQSKGTQPPATSGSTSSGGTPPATTGAFSPPVAVWL